MVSNSKNRRLKKLCEIALNWILVPHCANASDEKNPFGVFNELCL